MHRLAVIALLAWAAAAQAQDLEPHRLAVHLADGARWTETVTSSTNSSQTLFPNAVTSTETFSNVLKARDGGYVISRLLVDRQDHSEGGDAELNRMFADLADITKAQADLYNRLDYDTDGNLSPLRIDNWDDIQQRDYDLDVKTYGKDMADGIKGDPASAMTAEAAASMYLNPESLMSRLHRDALVVGVAQSEADTLDGFQDPVAAATTLTLTRWDDKAGEADYILVSRIDEDAGKTAVLHYLLNFLYPLNTMDEGEEEQLKTTAQTMTDSAQFTDERTCTFTASMATGLVTHMTCDGKLDLAAEAGSMSNNWHVEVVQTPAP